MSNEHVALKTIEKSFGKDRIRIISPDYFEILGTDQFEDTNKLMGEKFAAYRKAWQENPRKHITGNFPLHLDVESNNTCNLRCTMCQIPFGSMKPGYLEMDLFDKILEEVKEHGLPSMKFNFRGEPLMHPKIAEFVKKVKDAGVLEAQFNSNGALMTEKIGRDLIEAGLDRIKFSIDSINPETYNSIRRGTTYDNTISRVISFIELRNSMRRKLPSIQVQMVYMESNHREAVKYVEFWQDKVNRIGFSRYRSGQNISGQRERVDELKTRIPCPQLWQRLVVLWDGTVLMCCGDYSIKNPLGNIKNEKLSDIWQGKTLEKYRKIHLEKRFDEIEACRNCEINYA